MQSIISISDLVQVLEELTIKQLVQWSIKNNVVSDMHKESVLYFVLDNINGWDAFYLEVYMTELGKMSYLLEHICVYECCKLAIKMGNLDALEFLYDRYDCKYFSRVAHEAIKRGDENILRWAIDMGLPIDAECCQRAVLFGHFNLLVELRNNGCEWDYFTTYAALIHSKWRIFEWAVERGCEVRIIQRELVPDNQLFIAKSICDRVAKQPKLFY